MATIWHASAAPNSMQQEVDSPGRARYDMQPGRLRLKFDNPPLIRITCSLHTVIKKYMPCITILSQCTIESKSYSGKSTSIHKASIRWALLHDPPEVPQGGNFFSGVSASGSQWDRWFAPEAVQLLRTSGCGHMNLPPAHRWGLWDVNAMNLGPKVSQNHVTMPMLEHIQSWWCWRTPSSVPKIFPLPFQRPGWPSAIRTSWPNSMPQCLQPHIQTMPVSRRWLEDWWWQTCSHQVSARLDWIMIK